MKFSSVINEKIISSIPVGGGDIGRSYRVKTLKNDYFVKQYTTGGLPRMEAHGIEAMAESGTVKVPEVISYDDNFLVLGFLTAAPECHDFQSILGRDLARMHKLTTAPEFGFSEDNFIGTIPQKNSPEASWTVFFIKNRIDYQVTLASDVFITESWERLRPLVPGLLAGSEEGPCLIHGDLWRGNVMTGPEGYPVLIDPAAYYGHREIELGMTKLFGGFSADFYTAYEKEYPLKKGWRERQNLYMLYHVLNHFNMFGSGYKQQALSLMRTYLK
jgi:fructosamine-3-kinase